MSAESAPEEKKGRENVCRDEQSKNDFRHLMVQLRILLAFSVNVKCESNIMGKNIRHRYGAVGFDAIFIQQNIYCFAIKARS